MEINFICKEQVWVDMETRYWFTVDGESYAIVDCCGDLQLLDSEGYPFGPSREADKIFENLSAIYLNY